MSLPALSRADRLLLSIVLLLAVLAGLAAWLLLPPEKTGGIVKLPSTLYNAGYGAKAAYLALDRLEYSTDRLRRPIDERTLEGIGVLFVLKPVVGMTEDEVTTLEEWVKAGHALVVAPGPPDESDGIATACNGGSCALHGDRSLDQWFDLAPTAGKADDRVQVDLRANPPVPGWQPDRSDPLVAGIGPLVAGGGRRFSPTAPLCGSLKEMPAVVFWKDRLGTVGLHVKFGEGTVVALADTYPLSNLGVSEADNGLLLGNVVRAMSDRYPGTVAFDEYHLGFPLRDWSAVAIAKLTFTGQWGWAMGQAALVGVLASGPAPCASAPAGRRPPPAPAAPGVCRGGRPVAQRGGRHFPGRRYALPLLPRPALPAGTPRTGSGRHAVEPGGARAVGRGDCRPVAAGRRRHAARPPKTSPDGTETTPRCGDTRSWNLNR